MMNAHGRNRLLVGSLLLFALLAAAGCEKEGSTSPITHDRETYEEIETHDLDFTGIQNLSARTINGAVLVTGQVSTDPRLEVRKTVRASTIEVARAIAGTIEVGIQVVDGGIVITSEYPDPDSGIEVRVDYDLVCPTGVAAAAEVVNGEISIRGVTGAVTARAVNGTVAVDLSAGTAYDLTATTINGCIFGRLGDAVVDLCRPGLQTVSLGEEGDTKCRLGVVNGTIRFF